ncbi:ankyrin repeat domain-containing protein [Hydrogenophaga sp. BPS33]|uniref:ankyrin repeat domain-containing protein n=1 Tax=Hydrogenophaga sp. BPS33 TaxID=2651974 RepID=UPI00135B75A8|nr:ankyrin repeat domain-containing protein [Hydrogenophaga sp. BPS33]
MNNTSATPYTRQPTGLQPDSAPPLHLPSGPGGPATTTTTTNTTTTTTTTSTTQTTATALPGDVTTTTTALAPQPTLSIQAQAVREAGLSHAQQLERAIVDGDKKAVEALLKAHPSVLNKPLSTGGTALQLAVRQPGAVEQGIVDVLLWQGTADVNQADHKGMTPLHEAAKAGHFTIVAALLNRKAHPNPRTVDNHSTPLHLALAHRQESVVRMLLGLGVADVNARRTAGATPFYLAISHELLDMAKLLQSKGADVHTSLPNGWSPLLVACRDGSPFTVAWLIKQGVDLHARGIRGHTALHMAAMNTRHPENTEALRAAMPADKFREMANQPNDWRTLPVGLAAQCGQPLKVIQSLQMTQMAQPIQLAPTTFKRCWIIVGADHAAWDHGPFFKCGAAAGIEMHKLGDGMQDLSWQGLMDLPRMDGDMVALNFHSYWDDAYQQVMVILGRSERAPLVEVFRLLFEKGVLRILGLGCDIKRAIEAMRGRFQHDPGIPRPRHQDGGYQGLHITTVGGDGTNLIELNMQALVLWIEDGGTERTTGQPGIALLQRSAPPMNTLTWDAHQQALVIHERATLKAQELGDLQPRDAHRIRVGLLLMHASDNHFAEVKALVIEHGVDLNECDAFGLTALHHASQKGHLDIVRFILSQAPHQVHATAKQGDTPLHAASRAGHHGVVQLLLDHKASIHQANTAGLMPLHLALEWKHEETVRLLRAAAGAMRV